MDEETKEVKENMPSTKSTCKASRESFNTKAFTEELKNSGAYV